MTDPHLPGPAELAEAIQQEVLECVRTGLIPPNVGSFTELHDYCDANCLGGTEELLDRLGEKIGHQEALDAMCDLMNAAMPLVDRWIRSGGIADVALPASDNPQIS